VFLGFLILQNRLKPDSRNTIEILTNANIKCAMVTGDNVYTAIHAAERSSIWKPQPTYICDYNSKTQQIYYISLAKQSQLEVSYPHNVITNSFRIQTFLSLLLNYGIVIVPILQ
jgi:magnesium-transporting ATPase (P-type)